MRKSIEELSMKNLNFCTLYSFSSYNWDPLIGWCSHDCVYCPIKMPKNNKIKLKENSFKVNLGEKNRIFVGSTNDLFANNVPKEWIINILNYCNKYPNNDYLFQTKNPSRFFDFKDYFPNNSIFGVTIETNRENNLANCPPRYLRLEEMKKDWPNKKMISVEPIMDFDIEIFPHWIEQISPDLVNIGRDSNKIKDYSFPEPSNYKIKEFIKKVSDITKVNVNSNLKN
jgi:DNA repair photolyase